MRVLVTGSSGFVGSHVLEVLREQGHTSVGIDRYAPSGIEPDKWHVADLREDLREEISGVESIIHCAAHADISQNWKRERSRGRCFEDNVEATLSLLEQCPHVPFVFVSSACVYGSNFGEEVTEFSMPHIESPYAASKMSGESYVQAYAIARKTPWYAARLVSCVGTRYRHGHIADFAKQAMQSGRIVALDSGTHPKSFVHVRDAAERLVQLAQGDMGWGTYNVTSSERWSPRHTAALMSAMRNFAVAAEWPDNDRGWVGDPRGLDVSSIAWAPCPRAVEAGVREALESLGWNR